MEVAVAVEVTLKNYRCFPEQHPARFVLGDGITAFIGTNHAGKSSLLKFFYEFRQLFEILGNLRADMWSATSDLSSLTAASHTMPRYSAI